MALKGFRLGGKPGKCYELTMQHPEVLPFIAMLAVLFGVVVLALNVWSYKRRSKLTAEQRAAEDRATDEDGWFFW